MFLLQPNRSWMQVVTRRAAGGAVRRSSCPAGVPQVVEEREGVPQASHCFLRARFLCLYTMLI